MYGLCFYFPLITSEAIFFSFFALLNGSHLYLNFDQTVLQVAETAANECQYQRETLRYATNTNGLTSLVGNRLVYFVMAHDVWSRKRLLRSVNLDLNWHVACKWQKET